MKQLHLIPVMLVFFVFSGCARSIDHSTTETFKVAGNCDMCKSTIEASANKKGIAEAEWNVDTKVLKLTYDSQKTSSDEILKRIAYAGYDNEKFLAPDEAYAKLPACCQYDRMKKEVAATIQPAEEPIAGESPKQETGKNQLTDVYTAYFAIKDALVKDDGTTAKVKAEALAKAIKAVDPGTMTTDERTAWTKTESDLLMHAENIGKTKEVADQRTHFALLSADLYPVVKVFKADQPIYYQHCPMYNGGADWLSKENVVRNPYYGSSMLTCGKTTETIR
ncbi:MAG TPA: DUF3347 domain-containing protein [Fluviicola sp.]|nr:DUF3347 domain-containing protein [Fluviicola sp.]